MFTVQSLSRQFLAELLVVTTQTDEVATHRIPLEFNLCAVAGILLVLEQQAVLNAKLAAE